MLFAAYHQIPAIQCSKTDYKWVIVYSIKFIGYLLHDWRIDAGY